jgi:hypothetical protein
MPAPTLTWLLDKNFVTFDRPFLERFGRQRPVLEKRLRAMTSHLPEPYRLVVLPEMIYPSQGLELLRPILDSRTEGRAALEAGDVQAANAALAQLPREQAAATVQQLRAVGIIGTQRMNSG